MKKEVSIKTIRLNIIIEHHNGLIERHNFLITGFLFRLRHLIYNKKFYLRTSTEIRNWIGDLLQGIRE